MNRIIKFRVWDKELKYWVGSISNNWVGTGIGNVGSADEQPWKCMSFKGQIMSNDNMGGFIDSNQESYVIQQYTGLKDKNGKEIYEGDILNCIDRVTNMYVEVTYNQYDAAFLLEGRFAREFLQYNRVEIAGNIFKNPELLNK